MIGQHGWNRRRTNWHLAAAAAVVACVGVGACAPAMARHQGGAAPAATAAGAAPGASSGTSSAASAAPQQAPVVNHLQPARDSIGKAPTKFAWTAIAGADEYAVGVWNEVDQMVWRQNHIPGTSVDRPEEIRLEPGTYFWSISALQGGELVAESGLAAFVVRTTP